MLLLWQSRPFVNSFPSYNYEAWTFTRDLPETRRKKEDEEILALWWMLYQ